MATIFETITELSTIVTDAITAGVDTNIPARNIKTTLIRVATGQYKEVLPIIVPAECCIMGDELRATNVQPRTIYNASSELTPKSDVPYSYEALVHMESIVGDIVTGTAITPTTGNTEVQDTSYPIGDTNEAESAKLLTRVIRQNIDAGIGNKLEAYTPKPAARDVNYEYAARGLRLNKEFIQAEIVAYIAENYPTLKYSRTKCKQDVGFILDAIAYDLIYDGNWQSTNAGLAYWAGTQRQISASERAATLQAYAVMKNIVKKVVRDLAFTPTYQDVIKQVGVNASTAIIADEAAALIEDIRVIIDQGPDNANPTVYPDVTAAAAGLQTASTTLASAKDSIGIDVVDFISKNFGSFRYDSAKCRRDLDLILTDTAYDLALGTNYNGIFNGLAYRRPNNFYNVSQQREQTVGALNFAKEQASDAVSGDATAVTRIEGAFDEIVDILNNGTSAADAYNYPSPVGVAQDKVDAKDQLQQNKEFIQEDVVQYVENTYPSLVYDQDKCRRDVGYIVEGLCYDILYGGNQGAVRLAQSYFVDGQIQVASQETETIAAYTHLSTIAQDIIQGVAITKQTGNTLIQDTSGGTATATEATELDDAVTIITDALTAGTDTGIPAITFPSITWATAGIQTEKGNLDTAAAQIILDTIQFINTTYSDFVYDQAKCARDVGLILDAARYDWQTSTNFASYVAGLSYLRAASNDVLGVQKMATLAGFERARQLAVGNVNAEADAIAGLNMTFQLVEDVIFGGSNEGSNRTNVIDNAHSAVLKLELNKEFIVKEIHAHITEHFKDSVTAGTASNNSLTISDTSWLFDNMPVKLDDTIGGLLADTTYYVKEIISATQFSVSADVGSSVAVIADETKTVGVEADFTYDYDLCSRDVREYVEAIKWDMTYPQEYIRRYTDNVKVVYPASYKTRFAARYYNNAVLGSQEEDFYYLRNGTGLRLMSLDGLRGDLGPANEFGTSRPTAGAYASLDPGWGPADQRAWITARSPYVQNVSTFGYAATGQRIDGALHDGGNDSIVSNDFTQVISDGIGAHILNNGRAELVSVFTYYAHIGYLAESGGRVRATNGNNSYGDFGSVAEGVDPFEIPVTAVVDNRLQYNADITNAETNGNEFLNVEYAHAGNKYSKANVQVFGAGTGAVAEADEFRDGAIFQARLLDLTDSSGKLGGEGFLLSSNTAQTGSTTSITLAATDGQPSTAYPGMRVYITGGAGVGQYGIIDTYNSGSKLATVVRESDGVSGFDHVVPGTPIVSTSSSSTYVIEPAVQFSDDPATSSTNHTVSTSQNWTDMDFVKTSEIYTGVTGITAGGGNNGSFEVRKNTSKYIVNLEVGGSGYKRLDTITLSGTDVGGASPANDVTITVTAINTDTGEILGFDAEGDANAGRFVAVANATNTAAYSDDGQNWTNITLPGAASTGHTAIASGLIDDGSTLFRQSIAVIARAATTGSQLAYSTDGANWTAVALPGGNVNSKPSIAYGQNKFFLIFEGSSNVYTSPDGINWTNNAAALPATGYSHLVYGAGRFLAVKGTTAGAVSDAIYAEYTNATVWTDGAGLNMAGASTVIGAIWGKNRFMIVNSGGDVDYSLDRGATYESASTGSTSVGGIAYGQGVFTAVSTTGAVRTSENSTVWTTRTIAGGPAGYDVVAHGNPDFASKFVMLQTGSGNAVTDLRVGCKPIARVGVANEQVFEIRFLEPGSGYTVAPTITIVDPNNIYDIASEARIGDGALADPSYISRGSGYVSASADVTDEGSDGFADFFQNGRFIAVRRMSERPVNGSNIVFGNLPGQVFKLVNTVSFLGDVDGTYTAFLNISPEMPVDTAPSDGESITMRIRYSQVRLTGHDFLDIGTGNFTKTNYPGVPQVDPDNTKETNDADGGRVFFTATDQDGNFRVGDLFSIEQATGVATLNAEAFNIAGLQELSLGEVTLGGNSASITEFSTDPFFTANSDTIVPTQRAIKAYIEAQIGGGGASLNVNTVTAGDIFIGTNLITTVSSSVININAKLNFKGGVTGLPVAYNYFLR